MRTRLTLVFLAVVPFFFAAPAWAGVTVLNATTNPSKSMTVIAGQDFDLTLSSNQSASCQWQLAGTNKNAFQFVKKQHVQFPNMTGEDVWTFKATQKGASTIALDYMCGHNPKPAQEEVFNIVVR